MSSSGKIVAQSAINTTYGAGIQLGVALGYQSSKFWGAELGFQYLNGLMVKGKTNTNFESRAKQARLFPTVTIGTGKDNEIEPYAKMGLIIPIGGIIKTNEEFYYLGKTYTSTAETTYAFSLGWRSTMGVNYHFEEGAALFCELGLQSLSTGMRKTVYTQYREDGHDVLHNLNTVSKEILYVNKFNETSNAYPNTIDTSKPTEALRPYYQFGNLALNIGVKLNF